MKRVYLDYQNSAVLHPEVLESIRKGMTLVGNPSSVHAEGRASAQVVEESRVRVAGLVSSMSSEIIFTSGGTEANALALAGLSRAAQAQKKGADRDKNIHRLKVLQMRVLRWVINTAHHAADTENVHREKRAVKRDKGNHEVKNAKTVIHHAAEHFGIPEINAGKNREHAAPEKNIMNMRHDKITVVNKNIYRG